jgi:diguanylate cyclase (GGDEF)-like protein/PAS domain S-box-containing protein
MSMMPLHTPAILIVDDDLFMLKIMQEALDDAGFRTVTATDGDSAMAAYVSMKPDLVLLDLIMPGKDGFTTCRELRLLSGGEFTPILLVTGQDDTESIHHAFEAGATDFIAKPVNHELLIHRISYILRASRNMKKLMDSEARLDAAQHIAHLGSWELNPADGSFRGSDALLKLLGREGNLAFSSFEGFVDCICQPDRELVVTAFARACRDKSPCCLEFRILHTDGSVHMVRMQGKAELTTSGKLHRLVGTLQDITDMRHVEDRLSMLKEAVDCLPIGITIIDVNGEIIYLNPAEAAMHGYSNKELLGTEARRLGKKQNSRHLTPEQLSRLGIWRRESVNVRKNGEEFPVQLTSIAVKDPAGRCLGVVTACEDISNWKEAEKKLNLLAYYDSLTGLPNRGMFHDRLHHALAMAQRESHQLALLFIDLDNFKDVNDTRGHDFGDSLLQEVARKLTAIMRESDTLARLGGDEFVVILSSVTDQETTAAAAHRIMNTFEQPFLVAGEQTYCDASIGIALYPSDGQDEGSLIKCADTAMYQAKEHGRSQFRFFSSDMNTRIMHRVAMEKSLRLGLEKEEFFLHYQPKWDLQTRQIIGVEVLLRWQSSDFGYMLPSTFISLTENSGLIVSLGEWVLRTACFQARQWILAGHHDLKIAVNISGQQLKQPDFLEMLERIIEETGIDPGVLELEFTESVIMEKVEKTIDILRALKAMGLQLSIDDFGTGYSSLSYLKHFPVDRIKIDRSFVAEVHSSADDAAVIEAIIAMGHNMNLRVLAEGVENHDQLHFLTESGCDEVQGFYLALPMSAEDLTESLSPDNRMNPLIPPVRSS